MQESQGFGDLQSICGHAWFCKNTAQCTPAACRGTLPCALQCVPHVDDRFEPQGCLYAAVSGIATLKPASQEHTVYSCSVLSMGSLNNELQAAHPALVRARIGAGLPASPVRSAKASSFMFHAPCIQNAPTMKQGLLESANCRTSSRLHCDAHSVS